MDVAPVVQELRMRAVGRQIHPALLSELKDHFFRLGYDPAARAFFEELGPDSHTFFDAAEALGFTPIIGVKGDNDPYTELRALFHAACAEPDAFRFEYADRERRVVALQVIRGP